MLIILSFLLFGQIAESAPPAGKEPAVSAKAKQVPAFTGMGELPGEALIQNYASLQSARKEAKYGGLRSALSLAWSKLPATLFAKSGVRATARLRKHILSKHTRYFAGMHSVKEKLLPGSSLQWSAVYRVDMGRMVSDIKKRLHRQPAPKSLLITYTSLTNTEKSDIAVLFSTPRIKPTFKHLKKAPKRCRRSEWCLFIEKKRSVGTPARITANYVLKNRRKKWGTKQWSVESLPGKSPFSALPPAMLLALKIPQLEHVVVKIDAQLKGTEALGLLYQMQRQEPALFRMNRFTLGNGTLSASFQAPRGVDRNSLFEGIYLGEKIKITKTVSPKGIIMMTLQREIDAPTDKALP